MNSPILTLAGIALAVATASLYADEPGHQKRHHRMPPPSPVIQALDANHDHVISAEEIANASAALKTLDKNGDGKLDASEIMPPPPPPPHPPGPGEDFPEPPEAPPAK